MTRTFKLELFAVAVLWLAVSCGPADAAAPLFMGLGDLAGGTFSSGASGVSADGSVVTGSSGLQAFRWTEGSGMVGLGDLPGGPFDSDASGVSADGSVVVGSSAVETVSSHGEPPFRTLYRAFRWTQGQGMISLGRLRNSDTTSFGDAVSANGSVVVGMSGVHPFREAEHGEAFRWTQGSGMVGLGELPGYSYSHASGVSPDGSVIVGQSWSGARIFIGGEAFRWRQDSGMVSLGDLPGGSLDSFAYGVSADGAVIVGEASSASGTEAFLWDAIHGMRSLRDVMVNNFGLGASVTGWTLTSANNISADGQFIVGSGRNPNGDPEAWLARLDPEPTLPGDYNQDGIVDAADFSVWRDRLGQLFTLANENPIAVTPGLVDAEDYAFWKSHFGETSPLGAGSAAGSSSRSPVPEPAGLVLAEFGVAAADLSRPRRRRVAYASRQQSTVGWLAERSAREVCPGKSIRGFLATDLDAPRISS